MSDDLGEEGGDGTSRSTHDTALRARAGGYVRADRCAREAAAAYIVPPTFPRRLFADLTAVGHDPTGTTSSSDLAVPRSSHRGSTRSRPIDKYMPIGARQHGLLDVVLA